MPELRWSSALAFRHARQHLEPRAGPEAALDVVGALGGLHAQLASSAELTLHARVDRLAPGFVAEALQPRRTLVKTWAVRGTLHLLRSDELGLWVAAQAVLPPRHHGASWLKAFGLTRAQADAVLAAIPEALDGEPLTRAELADEVARITGSPELGDGLRESWGAVLKLAAFRGELCFGADRGRLVTFTRPDRWLGPLDAHEPDTAVREVGRRYLATYGPARREDFARWFGARSLPLAERVLAGLGEEVVRVEVEGTAAWLLAADVEAVRTAEPAGSVRLLPAFDQLVVTAARDLDPVVPAGLKARLYRPQGWLSPVLVQDGRLRGTWRHERRGADLAVEVAPVERPSPGLRKGVQAEAERLAALLGGAPRVAWS